MLQKAEAPSEPVEGEMDKSLDHPQQLCSTPLHRMQAWRTASDIHLVKSSCAGHSGHKTEAHTYAHLAL